MLNLYSSAVFNPISYFLVKIFLLFQIFQIKMHSVSPVMWKNCGIVDSFIIHFRIAKIFIRC